MASLPNAKTVTYEEWLGMPETRGEEVVNGEIRIMPPPKWKHSRIVQRLYDLLRSQANEREITVVIAEFGLVIRRYPLTSRTPDLAVFQTSTIVERDGYIHSAPQLVVEVLSPANIRWKREEKLADYTSIGVPEVWVIHPEARRIEVLYLENGQLGDRGVLSEGVLQPRLFPNVQVDIAQIWPD